MFRLTEIFLKQKCNYLQHQLGAELRIYTLVNLLESFQVTRDCLSKSNIILWSNVKWAHLCWKWVYSIWNKFVNNPHLLISINQVMLNHTSDYTIRLLRCRLYIFIVFKSINLHHIRKHYKYVFERWNHKSSFLRGSWKRKQFQHTHIQVPTKILIYTRLKSLALI